MAKLQRRRRPGTFWGVHGQMDSRSYHALGTAAKPEENRRKSKLNMAKLQRRRRLGTVSMAVAVKATEVRDWRKTFGKQKEKQADHG